VVRDIGRKIVRHGSFHVLDVQSTQLQNLQAQMLAQAQLMQQQMFGGGLGQNAWGAAGQQPMQQQMQMPYGMPQQVCFTSLVFVLAE
jgi:hypothetical protein